MNVYKLDVSATLPARNHPTDAGVDLFSLEDVFIPIGATKRIKTGIAIQVPDSMVGRIAGRSSMNMKGLITAHGVIDSGYSGDVSVTLHNFSCRTDKITHSSYVEGYLVKKGDKVAQFLLEPIIIEPVNEIKELWTSERGDKSFGSSGR